MKKFQQAGKKEEDLRPCRLMERKRRMAPFQGADAGSIPVGATDKEHEKKI